MRAYYNESDPQAAAWLRELMKDGLIPEGEVDERSITEVQANDVRGFTQCHWFAGIGGWSEALRLAGWPDDRPVWTGSCPCQPFSSAGKRKGEQDERHLWPELFRLIRECCPECVFGEQVAGAEVVGRADGRRADGSPPVWLDGVFDDLEGASYTCAAFDLPAASVGAPHIRQRLFWVAESQCPGVRSCGPGKAGSKEEGVPGEVRQQRLRSDAGAGSGGPVRMADSESKRNGGGFAGPGGRAEPSNGRHDGGMGNASEPRREGKTVERVQQQQLADYGESGFWSDFELILCRDGKSRRVPEGHAQPGVLGVADGLSAGVDDLRAAGDGSMFPLAFEKIAGRVGLLRGFGNAIVPEAAAAFLGAYLDATGA